MPGLDVQRVAASPFQEFSRDAWQAFRGNTTPPITEEELERLRTSGDPVDMIEVDEIHLPLSNLLRMHALAAWSLRAALRACFDSDGTGVPFVIGIAGGVAVGKSTFARLLKLLIERWPERPNVQLVTTDGFLRPTAELERAGLLARKGFPESYDNRALLGFMRQVKAGVDAIEVPTYCHATYDVLPGETLTVVRPQVLLVEGLNVLQPPGRMPDGRMQPAVSDFLDLGLYLDARDDDIRRWYVERFLATRERIRRDPGAGPSHYTQLSDEGAHQRAHRIYTEINEANLRQNIEPTSDRAHIVLHKDADHRVAWARIRK